MRVSRPTRADFLPTKQVIQRGSSASSAHGVCRCQPRSNPIMQCASSVTGAHAAPLPQCSQRARYTDTRHEGVYFGTYHGAQPQPYSSSHLTMPRQLCAATVHRTHRALKCDRLTREFAWSASSRKFTRTSHALRVFCIRQVRACIMRVSASHETSRTTHDHDLT